MAKVVLECRISLDTRLVTSYLVLLPKNRERALLNIYQGKRKYVRKQRGDKKGRVFSLSVSLSREKKSRLRRAEIHSRLFRTECIRLRMRERDLSRLEFESKV